MKVLIDSGSGFTDYTQNVLDGSLVVEDSINVPTLVTFSLAALGNSFKLPSRSSYVKITSEYYSAFTSELVLIDSTNTVPFYLISDTYPIPQSEIIFRTAIKSLWFDNGIGFLKENIYETTDPTGPFTTILVAPPEKTNGGFFHGFFSTGIQIDAPGTYNISFAHTNGFIFAIDGATLISGPATGVTQTQMPLTGIQFANGGVTGWNSADAGRTDTYQVSFPAAGAYQMEIAWASHEALSDLTHMHVTYTGPGVPNPTLFNLSTVSGKVLATGFVTNQPEPEFIGLNQNLSSQNYQQLDYTVKVTSDEWLLNCQSIPYIPAFVNQTDTQILAALADALMPGFFTTSGMASGTLIPYYQYDPSQTWSDVAKTFADQNRYWYKVINKKIYYQPFGSTAIDSPATTLGISYDETTQTESQLQPLQLKTTVVSVPPVNDCIVIGDVEPQANCDNYFVGDGFTSNFQLRHQVFQGTSSQLLSDDWTEAAVAAGTWIVNDPENTITLADNNGNAIGALNIVQKGTTQTYTPIQNATFIQAQNGLELGGGLNLQHGQVTFNDTASGGGGLIGGLFNETTEFDPGHCLAAFKVQGQPSLGNFTGVSVSATASTQSVSITVNGTNTQLAPGNVCTGSGFTGATWLNGQKLYITSIQQGATSYVLTCGAQNPGIIPSSYGPTADSGTLAFNSDAVIVTASGAAGIYMYPLFNGSVTGSPVVSQPNHQYVLQTWVGAEAPNRFTRPYTNLTQAVTYGAQNLASSGTITWVVTDYNIGNYAIEQQFPLFGLFPASPPPVVTKFSATHTNLPPFAAYVLLSGLDLNVSLNYTNISLPPQGYLTVQSLTGASGGQLPVLPAKLSAAIHYQLGFGMINQTAQVSQQGEAYALSFYTDDIPGVGARIRFQSWAAGQSIARVRDTGAIAVEGKISGDSGIRSAIMSNLSPTPRTSAECEAAAAAAIVDREYTQWQGSYSIQTGPFAYVAFFDPTVYDYPHTGLFLNINSPTRGIVATPSGSIFYNPAASGQNFFVNTVRMQVTDLREELLNISIGFGPDLYLEKQLPAFLEREQNLLVPTQSVAPPNPITIPEVLNAHLATLDGAIVLSQVNAPSGNYIVVDLSGGKEANAQSHNNALTAIGATGCEVRYVDSGWGVANTGRVGIFNVDQFTLPRTVRDQTFYLRGTNGAIFSRYSKQLRVVAPLVPSAPTLNSVSATSIVFDLAGDVRDIYGLEVRVPSISGTGVEFVTFDTLATDSMSAFVRASIPTGVGGNAYAIYSPPSTTSNYPLSVGDIILVDCTTSASFNGFRLITDIGSIGGGSSSAGGGATTTFTGNFQTASAFSGQGQAGSTSNVNFVSESWRGIAAALLPGTYTLTMNVTCSFGTNINQGGGVATVNYSIDGGVNFKGIFLYQGGNNGQSSASLSVTLPVNQDLTKVVVSASVSCNTPFALGAGGLATMSISNISVNTGFVTTPASNYVAWYDYNDGVDSSGIVGKDGNFGTTDLVKRGASVVLTTGSVAASSLTATLNTSSAHGLAVGDAVVISCGYTQPAGWQGTMGNLVSIAGPALQYTSASLTFTTPALSSGDLTSGGAFGSGGSVVFKNSVGGTLFSGSFTSGVWTLLTQANGTHSYGIVAKLSNGNLLFLEVNVGRSFWSGASTAIPQPQMTDGAVYCGNYNVISVPSSTQITIQLTTSDSILQAAGIPLTNLTGRLAKLPVVGGGAGQSAGGGIILQRVITAPADLVVDLTQPDIAANLRVLEASVTNGRISGIQGYFFNLTWDYSNGTPVPSFTVPSLSGVYIDSGSLQVIWSIAQGSPDGYRVLVTDQATGLTRNQFTVNHPSNPQLVKSFQLTSVDAANPVNIQITPFDAGGDGIPTVIPWAGTGGGSGGGGGTTIGISSVVTDYPLTGALISATTEELGILDFVGDTGSGGFRGTVVAPPAGSAASGMFLSASGSWAVPPGTPAQPYDIGCTYAGQLPASGVILHLPMAGPVGGGTTTIQFASNLVGSEAHVLNAPTSGFTCQIYKGGALLGSFTIPAGQHFATFTFTATTFTGGGSTPDVLIVITPIVQDPTAADLGFIIRGTRTATGA